MKRTRTSNQQGVGAVVIIAIVGVVALLGVLGYVLFTNMNNDDEANTNETSNTSQQNDATTDEEATSEEEAPAGEELKGVSIGMTRAEVEGVYGQPTSTCMDYPDGSVGCAYSNAELIGAGNGFEVAYRDDAVFAATFTDNSANTIQQLTENGIETVQ